MVLLALVLAVAAAGGGPSRPASAERLQHDYGLYKCYIWAIAHTSGQLPL